LLFPLLGRDFFPQVDAGQMRLHVRAPPGTRLEQTQAYFAQVEAAIRRSSARADRRDPRQYRPALQRHQHRAERFGHGRSDGRRDSDFAHEKHAPTADLIARLRRELPKRFAALQFFFQPADIVDQVLNFGQPAPIDIRVSGPNNDCGLRPRKQAVRAI
jgi:multidrug efflux pump subunit AcrB